MKSPSFHTKSPTVRHVRRLCRPFAVILLSAAVLWAGCAWSWTANGHHLVVRLTEPELTPKTWQAINTLLALEPGSTLSSTSTWADEHRNPTTSAWHYINFPRGDCNYVPERDCPEGRCVVSALERQLMVLASDAPPEKRLLALKYVTHFAADIHQPLHAAFGDDRGGNSYQVQALGRGTNLHALWDIGLGHLSSSNLEVTASRIQALGSKATVERLNPADIATESCRAASAPGFFPQRNVSPSYIDLCSHLVDLQLLKSSRRLAFMLNDAFAN